MTFNSGNIQIPLNQEVKCSLPEDESRRWILGAFSVIGTGGTILLFCKIAWTRYVFFRQNILSILKDDVVVKKDYFTEESGSSASDYFVDGVTSLSYKDDSLDSGMVATYSLEIFSVRNREYKSRSDRLDLVINGGNFNYIQGERNQVKWHR